MASGNGCFSFAVPGGIMRKKEKMKNVRCWIYFNLHSCTSGNWMGTVGWTKTKNHRALATANGFKGAFYWYCAIVNFLNYINSSWAVSKVAGFAIALAIIEGFNGWIDMLEETRKAYEK